MKNIFSKTKQKMLGRITLFYIVANLLIWPHLLLHLICCFGGRTWRNLASRVHVFGKGNILKVFSFSSHIWCGYISLTWYQIWQVVVTQRLFAMWTLKPHQWSFGTLLNKDLLFCLVVWMDLFPQIFCNMHWSFGKYCVSSQCWHVSL